MTSCSLLEGFKMLRKHGDVTMAVQCKMDIAPPEMTAYIILPFKSLLAELYFEVLLFAHTFQAFFFVSPDFSVS